MSGERIWHPERNVEGGVMFSLWNDLLWEQPPPAGVAASSSGGLAVPTRLLKSKKVVGGELPLQCLTAPLSSCQVRRKCFTQTLLREMRVWESKPVTQVLHSGSRLLCGQSLVWQNRPGVPASTENDTLENICRPTAQRRSVILKITLWLRELLFIVVYSTFKCYALTSHHCVIGGFSDVSYCWRSSTK